MTGSRGTVEAPDVTHHPREAPRRQLWRWDRLDALWWALVFMWGALVLVVDTTSLSDGLDWWDGAGVFWIGAGSLALIGVPLRLGMTSYRSKVGWTLFFGTIFLSFGLAGMAGPAWLALPMVVVAVLILGTTVSASRNGRPGS
jgi:hypothetical protein